jgi:hypothetical protein
MRVAASKQVPLDGWLPGDRSSSAGGLRDVLVAVATVGQQPRTPARATGGTPGDEGQGPHPLRVGEAQLDGDARAHREADDVGGNDAGGVHRRECVGRHHPVAVRFVGLVA